jgi:hypothetical protein
MLDIPKGRRRVLADQVPELPIARHAAEVQLRSNLRGAHARKRPDVARALEVRERRPSLGMRWIAGGIPDVPVAGDGADVKIGGAADVDQVTALPGLARNLNVAKRRPCSEP